MKKNILVIGEKDACDIIVNEIKRIPFLSDYKTITQLIMHPEKDLDYTRKKLQNLPPDLVIIQWLSSHEQKLSELLKFIYIEYNSAGVILVEKEKPEIVELLYSISVNFILLLTPVTSKQLEFACHSALKLSQQNTDLDNIHEKHTRQKNKNSPASSHTPTKKNYSEVKLTGISKAIRILKEEILIIADSDLPVAIEGESGTGKEIIARELHRHSSRAKQIFLAVNCATLGQLADTELFGQVKGAFTGAVKATHGYIGSAEGGTLFLDEVEQLSSEVQSKLLRFLDSGEYIKVGDNKILHGDVRIICASNRPFTELTKKGLLRYDFFYRISGTLISTTPLRERKEDIPYLVTYFLTQFKASHLKEIFSEQIYSLLYQYNWPGNVRELKNFIHQIAVRSKRVKITPEVISEILNIPGTKAKKTPSLKYKKYRESKEEAIKKHDIQYFTSLLTMVKGNTSLAIKLSGMHKKNFYEKLKKYGIIPDKFRT